MKKIFLLLTIIVCVFITGCQSGGTYFPKSDVMKNKLEAKGYNVVLEENSKVRHLSATKGNDYLEFYWLFDSDYVNDYYDLLKDNNEGYSKLISIKDDSRFGTLTFCGTKKAISAAGIKIVESNGKYK